MPTTGALIDVAAERGGAAAHDGVQDLPVQPAQPRAAALEQRDPGRVNEIGHLQRRPEHLFGGRRRRALGAQPQRVQRDGGGAQVALRQVNVNHRFAQVGVPEQQLDGAQVGAAFEQMGRSVWGCRGLLTWQRWAARRHACQTTFSVMGVSAV